MYRRRMWTETELHYLRVNASKLTAQQMAIDLNRTKQSIFDAARHHSICMKKLGDNNPISKYSDADVRLIRELSDCGISNAEIAKKFDLDPSCCHHLANRRMTADEIYTINHLPR